MDFLILSTEVGQSGGSIFSMYNIYNSAPIPYWLLLSLSILVKMTIGKSIEIFIAPLCLLSVCKRSDESLLNLHGLIQSPKSNTYQECTQLFPLNAELERHA